MKTLIFIICVATFVFCGCGRMRGADPWQTYPATHVDSSPIQYLPPAVGAEDFSTDHVNGLLEAGRTVPVLVLAYAEPGNTDMTLLREIVHRADSNATVDQDLARSRSFTDYPYSVDSYLVFVNSQGAYRSLLDTSARFPSLKVMVFPVFNVKLKSYLRISYTKPPFKDAVTQMFWIGDSDIFRFPNDTVPNLEDPSSYLPALAVCDEFGIHCLESLIKGRYFSRRSTLADTKIQPLQFLDGELASSLALFKRGITSDSGIADSFLKMTFDRAVIRNITLVHEMWASGPAGALSSSDPLFRVEGFEHHPIVLRSGENEKYFFALPINVSEGDIALRIRNTPSKMIELFEQMRKIIANALDEQI